MTTSNVSKMCGRKGTAVFIVSVLIFWVLVYSTINWNETVEMMTEKTALIKSDFKDTLNELTRKIVFPLNATTERNDFPLKGETEGTTTLHSHSVKTETKHRYPVTLVRINSSPAHTDASHADRIHGYARTSEQEEIQSRTAGSVPRTQEIRYESKKRNKILLVTYMRSGSTFVGSMLLANKDIFYVFEPLHGPLAKEARKSGLHYLNGTTRRVDYENTIQETVNNIMECKLQSLSLETLRDSFWKMSSNGYQYRQCFEKGRPISECVSILAGPCSQRLATAIKTIRYPMKFVEKMIQNDQSLKVIHLVRDPRSTLNSHLKWRYVEHKTLDGYSYKFCRNVHEDLLVTRKLVRTHPDNIKLILYEDMTQNTLQVAEDMYSFIGLPFTEDVIKTINKSKSENDSNCFLCTGRSNATHQLLKWRISMKYTDVETIDRNCNDVYDVLGYLPTFNENNLRNLSRPLRNKQAKIL